MIPMRWLLVMLVISAMIFFAGCAHEGATKHPEKAGFILVSEGQANGMAAALGARGKFCKITQYNLGGADFVIRLVYDNNGCVVDGTASSPE